jgi:hypothetical protein
MWFSPVTIDGQTYLDSVYITDGNLEEAVRRGADEIWAIWTVSRKDEWRDGFVNVYFQIIESVADTNFFTYWKRIEENNRRIAAGQTGEFGRTITLHLIEAEVPVHYLLNFSKDRMAEAVNQGVEDARKWCRDRNIPLQPGQPIPKPPAAPKTSLTFTEEMTGFVAMGTTASTPDEYQAAAAAGKNNNGKLMFHLDVSAQDVDAFITSPAHETRADGYIESPLFGGRRPVANGTVNLFVNQADPDRKNMRYRLFFTAADGRALTLVGFKDIDGPSIAEMWPETTTLYTQVQEGHVPAGQEGPVVASGVLVIRPQDFVFKQLFSFRTQGPSIQARLNAMGRFGAMFFGKIWDVYGPKGSF